MSKIMKVWAVLLCLMVVVGVCVACDETKKLPASSDGLAYVVNEDGKTCTVTGIGQCHDINIVIGHIDGLPVTAIGDNAFKDYPYLKSITVSDSVISIGVGAFNGCSSLKSVYITDIAKWCEIDFEENPLVYAHNLYLNNELVTDLVIPDSVTSIGGSAFSGCSSLSSITIPDSITSIGKYAFYGCSSLTSMTLPFVGGSKDGTSNTHFGYIFGASSDWYNDDYVPSSLKEVIITGGSSIGSSAFRGCSSLTSITIPDSVTSIGNYAFDGCSSLTSITIPDSVTSIDYMFSGCSSLTSITIPDSVTSIGDSAFEDCTSLTSITIPDSVTSIGSSAFRVCSSLKSITIPDSVTSIGSYSFYGCSSLTSITIPDSVISIGNYAFDGCSSLTSIQVEQSNPKYHSSRNCLIETETKTLILGCQNSVIPTDGSVTSIGLSAFDDCSSLTSVTIPDSVTKIGDYAFDDCSSLTDVYFTGTKEQWKAISIGKGNYKLTSATIHFGYTPN